jgi:hypothetical protein
MAKAASSLLELGIKPFRFLKVLKLAVETHIWGVWILGNDESGKTSKYAKEGIGTFST